MNAIIKDAAERMDKSYGLLQDQHRMLQYAASGGFLDTLKIEYYGSMMPLQQLAHVTSPYGGKFIVQPHDPSCVKDIEKAVRKANIGVGVMSDKAAVHVTVPIMSVEQKNKMAYHATHLGNEAKVAVRNIRQDARKTLLKAELPEDDEKKSDKELQRLTDDYCIKIDGPCRAKVKSLME